MNTTFSFSGFVITKTYKAWNVVRKITKEDKTGKWDTSSLFSYIYQVPGGFVETDANNFPKRVWPSIQDFVNALKKAFPNAEISQP